MTGLLLALLAVAVGYWLLIITEGTYLGPRIVTVLYDWTASHYNTIKQVRVIDEQIFLGVPLGERLEPIMRPVVVDIATGTGRVPLALLHSGPFDGLVLAVDRSPRMLAEAALALAEWPGTVAMVRTDAATLPIGAQVADCVTCLEALEFVANGPVVLAEAWRVLKPGGVLLMTNRIGWQAYCFPGRIARRGTLERACARQGFVGVETQIWQVDYDLVWARKPMRRSSAE